MINEDLFVATCASNLTSGTVKLIFPGETTASGKYYKVLNTTGITNGTRVIVAKTSGTYVVVSAFNVGGGGGGSGTVTSVGIKNTGGLTVSGSPITTSGEISIGHNNPAISPRAELGLYPIKFNIYGHIIDSGAPVYPTNKNLLDNWYFVGGGSQNGYGNFPINQRGQTNYNNLVGYGVDRWRQDSATTIINSDNVAITRNSSASWAFSQRVPFEHLGGKKMTFSALIKECVGSVRLQISYSLSGSAVYVSSQDITSTGVTALTFTMPDVAYDLINAIIWIGDTSSSVKLQAAKLELGDVQTLAHYDGTKWLLNELPSFDEQLTKCLRYFFCTSQNDDIACYGYLTDGGKVYNMRLAMPVTMVGHPTATMTSWWARGANGYSAYASFFSPATPTSLSCYREGGTNQFCNIIAINDRLSSTAPDANNTAWMFCIKGLQLSCEP